MTAKRRDALDWLAAQVEWECILAELHARAEHERAATESEPRCVPVAAAAPLEQTTASRLIARLWSPVRGMSARAGALRIRA